VVTFNRCGIAGVCTICGSLPLFFLLNANVAAHMPFALLMAGLSGALSSTVGPNIRAMILNCNFETRGLALALQTMLDDLGKGARRASLGERLLRCSFICILRV
jgi:hypothetical protein